MTSKCYDYIDEHLPDKPNHLSVPSDSTDQSGHLSRLIRVLAGWIAM